MVANTDLLLQRQSLDVALDSDLHPALPPMNEVADGFVPNVLAGTATADPSLRGPLWGNQTFSAIYREHFQAVWLTLRRFGVWERDLEDAVHDVFMVAHRRLADFDTSRPMRPWLKGIACYVASDFRRRAQHRKEVVDDGETAGRRSQGLSGHTPAMGIRADDAHDQQQSRALVLWALDQMDFDRRTVLVLHDIDGHAMPEVAEALGVNINTLYSRLRHARTEFKAIVVSRTVTTRAGGSS